MEFFVILDIISVFFSSSSTTIKKIDKKITYVKKI